MKNLILIILLTLLVSSCNNNPVDNSQVKNNKDFRLSYNDVTVFEDTVYFVSVFTAKQDYYTLQSFHHYDLAYTLNDEYFEILVGETRRLVLNKDSTYIFKISVIK